DLHTRAGRWRGEELSSDSVVNRKVAEVGEVLRQVHDIVERPSGGGNGPAQRIHHVPGLSCDRAVLTVNGHLSGLAGLDANVLGQVVVAVDDLAGCWIGGDDASEVHHVPCAPERRVPSQWDGDVLGGSVLSGNVGHTNLSSSGLVTAPLASTGSKQGH